MRLSNVSKSEGKTESSNNSSVASVLTQENRHQSVQPQPIQVQVEEKMSLFKTVPPNVVQSIRAFRVTDLQAEAAHLGQHFLYVHCAEATTKQQVLACIAQAFHFPKYFGKNFDALADCLTDLTHKAGPQPGFVVVLEQLPNTPKFDKEAREILLDVFRDSADFWAEKKVAFRVFYSFQ